MDRPNIFALPPGVDFAVELVRGMSDRWGDDPTGLARVEMWVNTARMQRRLWQVFDAGPPRLIPKIQLLAELGSIAAPDLPPAVSALQRRLELRQLVARLIAALPGLFPRAAAFDLADNLALLFTEMADEGVSPDALAALDISDHSGHWQRAVKFLNIAAEFAGAPDVAARQRAAAEVLLRRWKSTPPDHPIVIAGSTGSRGPVSMLMHAVAHQPQGAVVLPGFDFHMGQDIWRSLDDSADSEDHPQYRFLRILRRADVDPGQIPRWTDAAPASVPRNRIVSLALRPAPVTDGWMRDGPDLGDVTAPCSDIDLIEAQSPRAEALAIALRLRRAAGDGLRAALITPDRTLARRVTAALDRWGIRPDDSAGEPLTLTPPGRLLRLIAGAFGRRPASDELIVLVNHPLVTLGPDRPSHLRAARDLEMFLRHNAVPFPTADTLETWATDHVDRAAWGAEISALLGELESLSGGPLSDLVAANTQIATRLSGARVWDGDAGESARSAMDELAANSAHGGRLDALEYQSLLALVLARDDVRDAVTPHPAIMIWGTLEARVQAVDLAILGGLNESVWPKTPNPDPWLNRQMRRDAGLLLPERQIGLSAHDFQQAVAADKVVLSRSLRDDDAPSVPARWINRITNLLGGLRGQGGPEALQAMRARGDAWLRLAEAVEHDYTPAPPALRPSPAPPVSVRPRKMSVTRVSTLVRDPYAIYARDILRVQPLGPLRPEPDAALRGTIVHRVLERLIRASIAAPEILTESALMDLADKALASLSDWPAARRLWRAGLAKNAGRLISQELLRRVGATPLSLEPNGRLELDLPQGSGRFALTGAADRIDRTPDGSLIIYDYKTGHVPTQSEQKAFDKQLYLLAIMAEAGAFEHPHPVPSAPVIMAAYLGVGSTLSRVDADLGAEAAGKVRDEFLQLLAAYGMVDQGYTARAAVKYIKHPGDYDHLARYREWDDSDGAVHLVVGR